MNIYWIPVIAIIATFTMITCVVWLSSAAKQRIAQANADVRMKLVDRFGTATEFVTFIQSPEGKQFLGDAPRVARHAYIGGIRWGIVMAFVGLGFVFCAITQHDRDFYVPASILLFLGLGFFVSSMMSMKIARQMESSEARERPLVTQ